MSDQNARAQRANLCDQRDSQCRRLDRRGVERSCWQEDTDMVDSRGVCRRSLSRRNQACIAHSDHLPCCADTRNNLHASPTHSTQLNYAL